MLTEKFVGSNTVFTLESGALWRTQNFGDAEANVSWTEIAEVLPPPSIFAGQTFRDFEIDPFCPAMQGTGREVGIYLLTDTGLYYCPDATAPTVTESDWHPKGTFANYHLIRAARSEEGTVIAYSKDTTPPPDYDWYYYFDFRTGQHGWSVSNKGTYVPGTGFVSQEANFDDIVNITRNFDSSGGDYVTLKHVEVEVIFTGTGSLPSESGVRFGNTWVLPYATVYSGTDTWDGTIANIDRNSAPPLVEYRHGQQSQGNHHPITIASLYIAGSFEGTNRTAPYSDSFSYPGQPTSSQSAIVRITNAKATAQVSSPVTFGQGSILSTGMDIGSWPDGEIIHAAGQDGRVYEATSFGGSFSYITPVGSAINGVRIWERRLNTEQDDVKNDDRSQLHGLVSYASGTPTAKRTQNDYGATLDFSPQIGGNSYIAGGPYAYDVLGHNPHEVIFAGYQANAPSQYKLIKAKIKDDGTVTYTDLGVSHQLKMVTFADYRSQDFYASGPSGVGFYDATANPPAFNLKNGNLPTGDYLKVLPAVELPADCAASGNHKRLSCDLGSTGGCYVTTGNPIELRSGNKVLTETDLTVQSPSGSLAFTRSYIQDERGNTDFQLMGMGWIHNHVGKVTLSGTSPNRAADVRLGNGGLLKLVESGANHFEARAGSAAFMDYDAGAQEYILTAHDQSTYVFAESTKLLVRRTWPNHEVWAYSYDNGNLTRVEDGYGRQLRFAYINNPGQFNHNKLWRVGDHTADLSVPNGRYVEFGYVVEQLNGIPVTPSPRALLATVRDVRGQTWGYDYYGQDTGESNTNQANFMLRRLSPAWDSDGDGSVNVGSEITLEQLSYTLSGSTITAMTQQRGNNLLQTALAFQQAGGTQTTETVDGKLTTHHFGEETGVYLGPENPLQQRSRQTVNRHYRPVVQLDPAGNETVLEWSGNGKNLQRVTDALSNTTQFSYDSSDRLISSTDAEGRKTEYTYGDATNPRLPTIIKVRDTDGGTVLQHQTFSYDSKGRVLTERQIKPADGTTILREATRSYYAFDDANIGARGMLQTLTQQDMGSENNDVSTTYIYDSYGRVVQTNQNSTFGSCIHSYTVYDEAGQVVASICNYENAGAAPTTAAEAVALYNPANPDHNRVTTHTYDQLGRRIQTTVNAGSSEALTTLTVYDALNRVVRTVSNFVAATAPANPYTAGHSAFNNHGADNTQNLVTDTTYNARGLVESQTDVLGNVARYVYDDAGRQVKVIQNYVSNGVGPALWVWNNNRWENGSGAAISHGTNNDQNLISTSAYDANGNLIQTRDVLGKLNRTVYDVLNRVVKTVRNWQSSGTGYTTDPTTWVWNSAQSRWEDATGQPIPSGANNDQNLVAQTKYDHMGRVVRTQDETGEWVLFGYDLLGRQVRVIRNASNPAYDLVVDPDLSSYSLSSHADQDILTTTFYDAQGRVDYTEDVNSTKTKLVYDGLGRQVKVIQNYIAQGTSDPAAWVWDPADQRWERGASDNTAIVHGSNQDQNIITLTTYDTDGRVRWTQDVLGRKTWHVYDTVGREIKTIVNCTYNGTGTTPEDPAYTGSPDSDKDVITQTVYDAFGRVSATLDARGNETRYFYNKLGRRTRTIANYVAQGGSDPTTWVWDSTDNRWEQSNGTAISHGSNNDENLVSEPTYDLAGRVITSCDPSGKVMQQVYDKANRRLRTIANYVVQGSSDPAAWVWDTVDQRWEDGSGNAINHGTDFDLNLISDTVYNVAGQVTATRDGRGTRTGFVYDGLGRRQQVVQAEGSPLTSKAYTAYDKGGRVARSVRNWQSTATTHDVDPLLWTWNATLQRWEDNGTPIQSIPHGVLNDQNLPMAYTVDKLGRMVSMTSPVGSITRTTYHKDGRVKSGIDAAGIVTRHAYDQLHRVVKVVQNFQEPVARLSFTGPAPDSDLYVVGADGSNLTNLTGTAPNYSSNSAWSPDGNKIAFASNRDGNYEIYTMNADGSGVVRLTTSAGSDLNPRWSPDGSQIAFISTRTGTPEIYVMNADGSSQTRLTNDPSYWVHNFAWSPDGSKIAFLRSYNFSTFSLWVMNADGSNTVMIDSQTAIVADGRIAWSPDNVKIAYMASPSANAEIFVINADGTNKAQLTTAAGNDQSPSWSPDGSQMAFYSMRDGGGEIYVMNADGTNQIRLTFTGNNGSPLWSPDGSQIAFTSSRDGSTELYVMDTNGANPTRLTSGGVFGGEAVWSPAFDPFYWRWDSPTSQWKDRGGRVIPHGTAQDTNIIAEVILDVAGRQTAIRDPRGNQTTYAYDWLNRRTGLTQPPNPTSQTWLTAYADLSGGQSRVTATNPLNHQTEQNFDRLGRVIGINYLSETPKLTPDVALSYDLAGNRTLMREFDGATTIRRTEYGYDAARRLVQVGFDNDGNGAADQTVTYDYDRGGLRTQMTLPGNLTITYTYDQRGQLLSLTDWDNQPTRYAYDAAGRLVSMERPNEIRSVYTYDPASRLKQLRHARRDKVLGHFAYTVDARGNRTKAVETLPRPTTSPTAITSSHAAVDYYRGTWITSDLFKETINPTAAMRLMFFGKQVTLTLGVGPDHGICDIYVDHTLWQSIDSYAAAPGEDSTLVINLADEGPHLLDIRNRADKNVANTTVPVSYKLRFKQLAFASGSRVYDLHSVDYTYDALARLSSAKYRPAANASATPFREYTFSYDRAGNRTQQIETVSGTPTTTNYTYDTTNRMTQKGAQAVTYDNAGRLTNDGTLTYTWDRAGRMLNAGTSSYAYNGLGQRISQTVGANVTQYLLDTQPGLYNVLAATTGTAVDRYVHGPTGIQAQKDSGNNWEWQVSDLLGSVRTVVDNSMNALYMQHYAPYGTPWGAQGTAQTPFGFTGEPTDGNNLLHLRARYYNPALGIFPSLDPLEGSPLQPMSLNRYAYVQGNPVNRVDPSGLIREQPLNTCSTWQDGGGGLPTNDCIRDCMNSAEMLNRQRYPNHIPLNAIWQTCYNRCQTDLPWDRPTFTQFPIDAPSGSTAYNDLFDGTTGRGCRLFAMGSDAYQSTGGLHPGFDFYVPEGTPVVSVGNGIIVGVLRPNEAGPDDIVSRMAPEDFSAGRYAVIARYGYTYVIYEHLGSAVVGVGDILQPNSPIGTVGVYDDGYGSHLHFEVRTFTQADQWLGDARGILNNQSPIPLNFVAPQLFFDSANQTLMDSCVGVSYSTSYYTDCYSRPNQCRETLPSNQNTRCFGPGGVIRDNPDVCLNAPAGVTQ